jgi:hypothetical protein
MIDARAIGVGLLLAAAIAGPAVGQAGKKHDKGKPHAEQSAPTRPRASAAEIRIIHEYYVAKGVKPKPLPPGIAKTRLPDDLVVRLPARPNYLWISAGNVVILVDPVGVVVDILREIF